MTTNQKWMVAIIVIVLLSMIGAVSGGNGSGNGISSSSSGAAKSTCHYRVEGYLTSPATAKFHDETVEKNTDDGLTVSGEVDSENGFGALLTSFYYCDTTPDGATALDASLIDRNGNTVGGDTG